MNRYENLTENELLEKIWENIIKKWVMGEVFTYNWNTIKYERQLKWTAIDIDIYINWKNVFFGSRNILDIIAKPIAEMVKDWISYTLKEED
jgi:hypothetical protein